MSLAWLFADRAAKSKLSAPIALKNIHVASPCRADWAQMSGDDRVRRCSECKLNVYNLSEMSRREAEKLIASREGRLCVRFYRRADGTVITRNCPVGFRQLVRRVSRVAGTALSALMSVSFCAAQTASNSAPQTTTQNDQKTTGALMTVTDAQGAVVSGVQVNLVMKSTKKRFTVKTDSAGTAKLTDLGAGKYKVEINAQGFKPYHANAEITQDRMVQINVKLTENDVFMGELIADIPFIDKTSSTVVHTFEGDLMKAISPH